MPKLLPGRVICQSIPESLSLPTLKEKEGELGTAAKLRKRQIAEKWGRAKVVPLNK